MALSSEQTILKDDCAADVQTGVKLVRMGFSFFNPLLQPCLNT